MLTSPSPRASALVPALVITCVALTSGLVPAAAQSFPGAVVGESKISSIAGGFAGALDDADAFGRSLSSLGDLDGDGTVEVAVGALGDDDGGLEHGAVWVLSLAPDGTVVDESKISETAGGFTGDLDTGDWFGFASARLPDLDGDGVPELAVGAPRDDDGGANRGAVYILFLDVDGSVGSHLKLGATSGGFVGPITNNDQFGTSLACLGDLDGDGSVELAVGALGDDDGGANLGAVWVLSLGPGGALVGESKISATSGGFTGSVAGDDQFAISLSAPGDLDGDGVDDLVVGARAADDGGPDRGAVWLLFLATDGSVKGHGKISATDGGLVGPLEDGDFFGASCVGLGDLDGDGHGDLAVGANLDAAADGIVRGSVWVLFLDGAGGVRAETQIAQSGGGFVGDLDLDDDFGISLSALGDLSGDGQQELITGALWDDDGGTDRGALWLVTLDAAQWIGLGHGLAGAAGVPSLTGEGTLVGGELASLTIADGLPGSSVFLVLGFTQLELPLKGGVLVPDPVFLFDPIPLDGAGGLHLPFVWPVGQPSDLPLVMQGWIPDAAAVKNFASTNGLLAITP
jgi:hypothetical protein